MSEQHKYDTGEWARSYTPNTGSICNCDKCRKIIEENELEELELGMPVDIAESLKRLKKYFYKTDKSAEAQNIYSTLRRNIKNHFKHSEDSLPLTRKR